VGRKKRLVAKTEVWRIPINPHRGRGGNGLDVKRELNATKKKKGRRQKLSHSLRFQKLGGSEDTVSDRGRRNHFGGRGGKWKSMLEDGSSGKGGKEKQANRPGRIRRGPSLALGEGVVSAREQKKRKTLRESVAGEHSEKPKEICRIRRGDHLGHNRGGSRVQLWGRNEREREEGWRARRRRKARNFRGLRARFRRLRGKEDRETQRK